MDWNGNALRPPPFLPRPETSLNFIYNNSYHDQYPPGLEMRYPVVMGQSQSHGLAANRNGGSYSSGNVDQKKKRLTNEQLESLENSFQEEIKLEPDRKMRLARDLGMQPRQVAIWFQNRRARWKSKQIERLYDNLKLQYDNVSREKQKLQEEVMKLRAMMKDDRAAMNNKQVSRGYTEVSGEETVDSTSVGNRSSCKAADTEGRNGNHKHNHHNNQQHHHQQQIGIDGVDHGTNYVFNVADYNHQVEVVPPNYWTTTHVLPSHFP